MDILVICFIVNFVLNFVWYFLFFKPRKIDNVVLKMRIEDILNSFQHDCGEGALEDYTNELMHLFDKYKEGK